MAELLKRIVVAQIPNVLISDEYLTVFLKNAGDSIDLLVRDSRGTPKYTLEEIAASKSLDGAILNGHVKLYDAEGVELTINNQIKATNLLTIYDHESGGSTVGPDFDWRISVKDRIFSPPGSPATGDRYLINGGVATGDWAGEDDKVAEWNGTSWDFTTPNDGFTVWVEDEDLHYTYDDVYPTGSWITSSGISGFSGFSGTGGGATSLDELTDVTLTVPDDGDILIYGYSYGYGTANEWTNVDAVDYLNALGVAGTSGFSGFSGDSGFSGYSGVSGFSGYSGVSGFSGYSGVSGFSGYSGIDGAGVNELDDLDDVTITLPVEEGDILIYGYSYGYGVANQWSNVDAIDYLNALGITGEAGLSGFSGYSGVSGFSGYSGVSGFSGYSGVSGFSGYSGVSGFSGSDATGAQELDDLTDVTISPPVEDGDFLVYGYSYGYGVDNQWSNVDSIDYLTAIGVHIGAPTFTFENGIVYITDPTRGDKKLSIESSPFQFAKRNNVDGSQLEYGGDISSTFGPIMPLDGTIVYVAANSSGGNTTKSFDIEVTGTTSFSISLTGGTYTDTATNVDFSAGDYLSVFCSAVGSGVINPSVTIWVKWRT